jgi:hypothetical protein
MSENKILDLESFKEAIEKTSIPLITGGFVKVISNEYCGCPLTILYCYKNKISLNENTRVGISSVIFDYFHQQGLTDTQLWTFVDGVDGNGFTDGRKEEFREFFNIGNELRKLYIEEKEKYNANS